MANKTTIALSDEAIKALQNRYGPKFDQDKYMPGARMVSRELVKETTGMTGESRVRQWQRLEAQNGLSNIDENIRLTLLLHGSRDDYESASRRKPEETRQREYDERLYAGSGARIDAETGANKPVDPAYADEVRRSNRDQARIDDRPVSVVPGGRSDKRASFARDMATLRGNLANAAWADAPVAPFPYASFSKENVGQAFALRGYTPVMSDRFGRSVEFGLREGDRMIKEAFRPLADMIRSRFSF